MNSWHATLAVGSLERRRERAELALAADHGRVEPPREPAAPGTTSSSRNASTGADLPLSSRGSTGSTTTASRTSRHGVRSEQDLAGSRRLLEPGRHVDRVAGHQAVAVDGSPATTSPVLTRPAASVTPWSRSSSLFKSRQRLPHVVRRAHRAERIVLVQLRDAEDRHDRVTDELLHRATVALQRARISAK